MDPAILTMTSFLLTETDLKNFAIDLSKSSSMPLCIALWGDLGSGKTTFCRAFLRQAMNLPMLETPSPTFTLVQHYITSEKIAFWHCDFYRLKKPTEIEELGILEYLCKDTFLIEWPERMGSYLPSCRLDVHLTWVDDCHRQIAISKIGL